MVSSWSNKVISLSQVSHRPPSTLLWPPGGPHDVKTSGLHNLDASFFCTFFYETLLCASSNWKPQCLVLTQIAFWCIKVMWKRHCNQSQNWKWAHVWHILLNCNQCEMFQQKAMQLLCFMIDHRCCFWVLASSHPSLIPSDSWWVDAGTLGLDSRLIHYSEDVVAHRDGIWIKAEPQTYLTATFAFSTSKAQTTTDTVTWHKNHSHRLDPLCEWAAVQTLRFKYKNMYILASCHIWDWGYLYYNAQKCVTLSDWSIQTCSLS